MFYKLYMKKGARGFTLIELLVVIAIIGILATIVLASLNSARERARDAKRVADIRQIQPALELYADDNNGNYPPAASWEGDLEPTYITELPVDPQSGALYTYETTGTRYLIMGTLENGNHTALSNDVDNATLPPGFSTDCDDPNYCITN